MTVYYGRFLESNGVIKTGGYYYRYFNSKEAIFTFKDFLKTIGNNDILEAIGVAEFNKMGLLCENESEEELLYNPDEDIKV